MEVMSLGKEEAVMILQGKLHIELPKLSSLILQCFHDEQGDVYPFVFGSKVSVSLPPTIEKLGLLHCAFKEIFPAQAPGIDCTKILSQLKTLELLSLFQLESIGLGHSWVIPLLQNLNTLHVWDCHCLTNLTPSTVSFSNLIKLNVKNCRKLKYLFTFSTAKTLVVLKEVCVTNCKSLETIVADTDGDDLNEDNEVEEEGQGEGNEDDVEEEGQGESEDEDDEDDDDDEGDGDEDENEGDRDEDDGVKEEEGQGGGELHEDKNKDEDKANANAEVDGDEDENEGGGDEDNDVEEEEEKHGEGENDKDKDKDDAEGDGDKDENKGDNNEDGGVEEEEGQGEGEDDQDEDKDKDEVKAYAM